MKNVLGLIAFLTTQIVQAQLNNFLPPIANLYAANADLVPPGDVPDINACAALCLTMDNCISINICTGSQPNTVRCGVSGYNISYVPTTSTSCSWYRRITPRNDTVITQAIPWLLAVPQTNVMLNSSSILGNTFYNNINTYLKVRDPLDMLYFFAMRAGNPNPPGYCFGWDEWIKGSATGNYLMGAGGALRWVNDTQLYTNVLQVIEGIQNFQDPTTGWLWAFNESDIWTDNLPDYCASWVTRGLLDVHNSQRYTNLPLNLARESISLFNNHTKLPWFLPQNGGPNPVQPYPSGFNNQTSGGYGQANGHMIYIEYQGMIKHTLMALSGVGTQADIDIIEDLYQENWWLDALLARDPFHAIWHRQFFSHNYEVTAYEAFLDMYVLTGNVTYLNAMYNAWSMLRENWILPGGSFALNEGSYYPPGSYYIGFTGTHVSSKYNHNHAHDSHAISLNDPYYHAPCMPGPGEEEHNHSHIETYMSPLQRLRQPAMEPGVSTGGPNDSDPPTGELCGSVFWTKFNQRFHRLFPDNETYVMEMERSIINVGIAALGIVGSGGQGPNGTGIRYFANQHKQKQYPSMHASCCEGQGTRLFGSLPEYVYTLVTPSNDVPATGIYVDLYSASVINFMVANNNNGVSVTLEQQTNWPYDNNVKIIVTSPVNNLDLDIALRIPSWVASANVPITVNGQPWSSNGIPGTYLHIHQTWTTGASTIEFQLPMDFIVNPYNGHSQLPPYQRYGYQYGPILLSIEGPWNQTVDSIVMPASLDPNSPSSWLVPANDNNSLHWNIQNYNTTYLFKPYYEVQNDGELFTNYPCF